MIDNDNQLNVNSVSYENWYDDLPNCPCIYEEAKKLRKTSNPKGEWNNCGEISTFWGDYHYGAKYEIRWAPEDSDAPGQQCTFDVDGMLITSGLGAGTPDKDSPDACGGISGIDFGHIEKDVDTWKELPCLQYLEEWPPNQGSSCSPNPINGIQHMRVLIGGLTCEEVTMLFKAVKAHSNSSDLRTYILDQGNSTPQNLKQLMQGLLVNLDCDSDNEDNCVVVNKTISNL